MVMLDVFIVRLFKLPTNISVACTIERQYKDEWRLFLTNNK